MATTSNVMKVGRDVEGRWRPGFMTHRELVRELETATGDRRAELVREALARRRQSGYPPFPDSCQLPEDDAMDGRKPKPEVRK
jgi:hypothetical protein